MLTKYSLIALLAVATTIALTKLRAAGPDRLGSRCATAAPGAMSAAKRIGLATRHLWIQSLPADQVPACGMGIGYMLDTLPFFDVIERTLKGSGECAKVDLVLGLSIPAWTLGLFAVLIVWSFLLAIKRRD